jgi:transposase
MIMAWHRSSEASRRLDDIPGIGPALAIALVASVAAPKVSDQEETSRPGLDWCRSRARAEARTVRRYQQARRPTKVATIALANKIARIAWAIMAKGDRYKEPAALAA